MPVRVVPPAPIHVPPIAKHPPFSKFIPLAYEVVVPLSKKFQPVPVEPMDSSEPGVVVPMPTFPLFKIVRADVEVVAVPAVVVVAK